MQAFYVTYKAGIMLNARIGFLKALEKRIKGQGVSSEIENFKSDSIRINDCLVKLKEINDDLAARDENKLRKMDEHLHNLQIKITEIQKNLVDKIIVAVKAKHNHLQKIIGECSVSLREIEQANKIGLFCSYPSDIDKGFSNLLGYKDNIKFITKIGRNVIPNLVQALQLDEQMLFTSLAECLRAIKLDSNDTKLEAKKLNQQVLPELEKLTYMADKITEQLGLVLGETCKKACLAVLQAGKYVQENAMHLNEEYLPNQPISKP